LQHTVDHAGADVVRPSVFALAAANAADTAAAGDAVAPAECQAFRNIDSETVAYYVIPGGTLGEASVGDIVVARVKTSAGDKYVYGVAADEGPIGKFGEGSILFNQKLLGKTGAVMNNRGLNMLDIDHTPVAVAILGGTRDLLKGDFSQGNVEKVARAEFARWGGGSDPERRMDACAAAAKVIPRH
jgi:Fungal chitosanase of glycosyl hydrolase group 75